MTIDRLDPRTFADSVRALVIASVGVGVIEVRDVTPSLAGRSAAGVAFADLGSASLEVARDTDGAPIWPRGFIGSIAHTNELAVAVVARTEHLASLGIDLEAESRRIDIRTAGRICAPQEQPIFSDPLDLLRLFCAKEAAYKALAPLGASRLSFQDVIYVPTVRGLLQGRLVEATSDLDIPSAWMARTDIVNGFMIACVEIPVRGHGMQPS